MDKFKTYLSSFKSWLAPGERSGSKLELLKKWLWRFGLLLIGYLLLVPFIQPLLVVAWEFLPFVLIPAVAIALTLAVRCRLAHSPKTAAGLLLVVWLLAAYNIAVNIWGVEWQMASSLAVEDIDAVPITLNNRIQTRITGREFAKNGNNDNRCEVGEVHLIKDHQGHTWWQAPQLGTRYPSYSSIRWFGSVIGVVRADADETEQVVTRTKEGEAFQRFGPNSFVTEALFRLHNPASRRSGVIQYQKENGQWVTLITKTSKRPSFVWNKPSTWCFCMVTKCTGVMEVSANGWVTNHSLARAKELFPGASPYPTELFRQYGDAWGKFAGGGFRGLWARVASAKGLKEVSEDDQVGPHANPLPYIQDFKELGLQMMLPFEPEGNTAYNLTDVLFADVATGKVLRWKAPSDSTLNGPRRAAEHVFSANPGAEWKHFVVAEGKLAVASDRTIYWLYTVLRNDPNRPQASHSFVTLVLVKAQGTRSLELHDKQELHDFLEKGKVPEARQSRLLSGAPGK